jgi:phosphoribosyl-ATP pyrophosphohydrolase/phosphoribosyl-AMP cyclohydrolase
VNLEDVKFNEQGLVPVVMQDAATGEVLTLAWANREALEKTLETGYAHFFSRSRQKLWKKGEESGNVQEVLEVVLDCDQDAVLYKVRPQGPACHTGKHSCFHNPVWAREEAAPDLGEVTARVFATIEARLRELPEGSYVAKLHRAGLDRLLKKIAEEAGEVILAAKNRDKDELRWEAADLYFHLLFTLAELGLTPEDLAAELLRRHRPKNPG